MADFLHVRYPGEETITSLTGNFRLLKPNEKPTGFVVSDFLHEKVYLFEPIEKSNQPETIHFSSQRPVVISRRDYQIEGQAFLNSFPLFAVEKGVYSRVKQMPFDGTKCHQLFQALTLQYPTAFCYLISSNEFGTWIGATPELLLEQKGMICKTVALASTHDVNDAVEWNQKEMNEHRYVVDAIQTSLELGECEDILLDGPKEHEAGPVIHLRTDFKATLTKPNAWEIVNNLHPTPAVCGTPRKNALDIIFIREMHSRELYTGYIGWFEEGNTKLFVNLRCAQLFSDSAYLYVGGGYTVDSIPDLEWEETERKAETILSLIRTI